MVKKNTNKNNFCFFKNFFKYNIFWLNKSNIFYFIKNLNYIKTMSFFRQKTIYYFINYSYNLLPIVYIKMTRVNKRL